MTPPFEVGSGQTKGGVIEIFWRAQILDPKMDHFLKRFPLSNAPNTKKIPPAAGQNPWLHQIWRSRETEGGVSWGGGGGFPTPYPMIKKNVFVVDEIFDEFDRIKFS